MAEYEHGNLKIESSRDSWIFKLNDPGTCVLLCLWLKPRVFSMGIWNTRAAEIARLGIQVESPWISVSESVRASREKTSFLGKFEDVFQSFHGQTWEKTLRSCARMIHAKHQNFFFSWKQVFQTWGSNNENRKRRLLWTNRSFFFHGVLVFAFSDIHAGLVGWVKHQSLFHEKYLYRRRCVVQIFRQIFFCTLGTKNPKTLNHKYSERSAQKSTS